MDYILKEINSENVKPKDIKDIAKCMRDIQKKNEQDFYRTHYGHMGWQGFQIVPIDKYELFVKNSLEEDKAKIVVCREKCCGKGIVGLSVSVITAGIEETSYRGCGRIVFFWSDEKYRKSTLVNNMYKKVWGWFDSMNCINVSINFKHFQKNIIDYFMKKGYFMNNVELVGPVRFLEKTI